MHHRFLTALGLALTLGLTLAAGSALAQTVDYQFSGTFSQGMATGDYSGTFTYDTGSDTVTAAAVTVEAGTDNMGVARTARTYNVVTASGPDYFLVTTAPLGSGNRVFQMQFVTSDLNSATPAASAVLDTVCFNAGCTGSIGYGTTVSSDDPPISLNEAAVVTPPAIPTMSEWAMIFFGVLLAGGAALYIQRRQLAA